ncbi:PREDICTED: D-inositol 3-phosphate glycosyltransferase-like [Acropora digitifera]|uniref:D-inositol 3-phosphate glycosyltransferase-like n=1 Tax=Acropora digitifera TaxID=70779 RepID=UPI00077AC199|nr:PREDICTED: D-inositol 3-phosphate glycosyltransferase-like [Acropora digitifera]
MATARNSIVLTAAVPSLRTLGRRAFTRTDEHSGFNVLQAAVLEGDYDTVTKASVHLENFLEEINCRKTGEKASILPGKSAADIFSVRTRTIWRTKRKFVKVSTESFETKKAFQIYTDFIETERKLTKLHSCAKGNDVEMAIELVLNDGMDVNVAEKRNITPLVWASPAASSLSIKTMIDLGADVNAQTFQERFCGFSSGTALRSAIHGNNANVVKVLLADKADANIADLEGNTVLHSSTSNFGISILDARKCVGLDSLVWLSSPPQDHKIDVIVGHGVKLGCLVQLIKRQTQFQNCKWVHVVHTASEDLSKYKDYSNPNSKGEKKLWDEVDLCKCADLVVPVGSKLRNAYHRYLRSSEKDEAFFELIPGLFEREFGDLVAKQNPKDEKDDFIVLLCGRGDEEDFEVKGYDIAVKAFADQRLKGKRYSLLFVGSPEGKQDEVRERLTIGIDKTTIGIDKKQLTVREFVKSREKMKDLFCEVDMVIMPSKSEGFGLVALEALSAGLPILAGSNSGFARAIEDVPLGLYSIVDSEVPAKWAEAIQGVCERHRVVLEEKEILKECYSKKYSWKTQCKQLVDRLWKMVYGISTAQAVAADDWEEKQPRAISE